MYIESSVAQQLIDNLKQEFPKAKVAHRDSDGLPVMVKMFIVMYKFIQLFNPALARFSFVVGQHIILPNKASYKFTATEMKSNVYKIVRHEMVHLRQDRDNFLWKLRYLFWPLPMFVTERGYRWEMEAYKETLRAEYELNGRIGEEYIERLVSLFTGATYLFMDVRKERVRNELREFAHSLTK